MTKKINTNDDKKQGLLNEPTNAYITQQNNLPNSSSDQYLSSDEFWKKVDEKRIKFCSENGIL